MSGPVEIVFFSEPTRLDYQEKTGSVLEEATGPRT